MIEFFAGVFIGFSLPFIIRNRKEIFDYLKINVKGRKKNED